MIFNITNKTDTVMKKYFTMMLAVAAIAVACEKDNNGTDNNGDNSGITPPENVVTYEGVTYKTVTLSNGQTWMAENLRFIPKGKTVSEKPEEQAGIWYPYSIKDGKAVVAKDDETITKQGYLYDFATAFGVSEITPENFKTFEGTRGICPEGWHLPTRAEILALCGNALKADGENEAPVNEAAPFYDQDVKAGSVKKFIAGGWNFVPTGFLNKANILSTGKYAPATTDENNCNIPELIGKQTMTNYIGSTSYKATYKKDSNELTNIQFFSLNSMFVKTYTQGKVQAGYGNYLSGYAVRCIKDAAEK